MRERMSAELAQSFADQLGVTLQSLDPPALAQRLSDMFAFVEELDEAVADHPDAMLIVSLENSGTPSAEGGQVDGPA